MSDEASVERVVGKEGEAVREPIHTRAVSWGMLAIFVVGSSAFLVLVLALEQTATLSALLGRSDIPQNAFFFATQLLVVVGGLLFSVARLRPSDVGLVRCKLLQGVVTTILVWIVIQVTTVISEYVTADGPSLARSWQSGRAASTLVWFLVMLLGAGLFEEIVNRGFLYPQMYLKFRGSHIVRIAAALLVSQCLFAVAHIPAHILVRHMPARQIAMTVIAQGFAGVMLALLYLRTRNLWIGMGVHALVNAPTALFTARMPAETFLMLLVIAWPWLVRNPRQRGFASVEAVPRE
jgi:membrane protease YdiL (CAAX protease family)